MTETGRIDAVALRAGHICPECGCECYAREAEATAAALAELARP